MSMSAQLPPHLKQRYGVKKRTLKKRIIGILVAGISLALLAFATLMIFRPRVSFELRSFEVTSDTAVDVSWQVANNSSPKSYCALRAQNSLRQDVGYVIVTVSQTAPVTPAEYTITTESKATLVEILGCATTPELRVAAPNFPPGVAIPQQEPPGITPKIQ